MRCAFGAVSVVVLSLAAGCSAVPGDLSAVSSSTSVAADASATSSRTGPSLASDAGSEPRTASGGGVNAESEGAGQVPSRTADASGPFGDSDLWIGAGPPPTGLQRSLKPGDIPGPLWGLESTASGRFRHMQSWSRIFDGCWELHEDGSVTGGDYRSLIYVYGPDDRGMKHHPSCPDNSAASVRFSVHFGGPWGNGEDAFPTRAQALAWIEDRWAEAEIAERESIGLLRNAYGFGSMDSVGRGHGGPFGTLFAPWDAPVDEVQVVPESVLARDGVLRGLVRNWSRRLWAYEVTITAADREFVWPLSVQPGEVAPFEITAWDGPADPARIEFRVDADMSWHADPTRAWGTRDGVAAWELRVGELMRCF